MADFAIGPDDPRAADVRALLDEHLAFAQRHAPPEDTHALDVEGLSADDVSFYSLRFEGELLGVGALQHLDAAHGELKSMHTVRAARGRGVGRALLDYLIEVARGRGYRRISLETGSMEAFAPSRALYAAAGFRPCPPFARYVPSPNSVFMTLELAPRRAAPGR